MAKKKVVKKVKDEELDEFEDQFLDEDIEIEYPKLQEVETKEKIKSISEEDISPEEDFEFELEEEARFPDYKYLNLNLMKGIGVNDYEIIIEGQSHGFCNILVKHLLNIEGVNAAAYKISSDIEPPKIFIRLDNSQNYQIKDILNKSLEALREEVISVQNLFKKLF